jgi:hypothetical protein
LILCSSQKSKERVAFSQLSIALYSFWTSKGRQNSAVGLLRRSVPEEQPNQRSTPSVALSVKVVAVPVELPVDVAKNSSQLLYPLLRSAFSVGLWIYPLLAFAQSISYPVSVCLAIV